MSNRSPSCAAVDPASERGANNQEEATTCVSQIQGFGAAAKIRMQVSHSLDKGVDP
jgi:hypothetical protein